MSRLSDDQIENLFNWGCPRCEDGEVFGGEQGVRHRANDVWVCRACGWEGTVRDLIEGVFKQGDVDGLVRELAEAPLGSQDSER